VTEEVYDLGQRIKKLRERKGLTQKQLGELLGITREAVSRYENNKQRPRTAKIIQFARHLNTSTDYLFGLEDEPVYKIYDLSPQKKQLVLDFIQYMSEQHTP